MKIYSPLHVHSHYSLLDGLSKPSQIAHRCSALNISSVVTADKRAIEADSRASSNLEFSSNSFACANSC